MTSAAARISERVVLAVVALSVARAIVPPKIGPWLPASVALVALAGVALARAWALRREPADAPWRRDPGTFVLVALLAALMAGLLSHNERVVSDGIDHYVYLRSLRMAGDLDLADDYAAVSPLGRSSAGDTPIGRMGNEHPIGPALLWSPLYLVGDGLAALFDPQGRVGDGPFQRNAVAVAGLLWGWLGLLALHRCASARVGRGPALLATVGVALGTFLYWYLVQAPTMAHAPAFATAAFVMAWWLRPGEGHRGEEGPRRALVMGALIGLAALVRWSSALLAILLVWDAVGLVRARRWRALARDASLWAAGFLIAFLPQLVVWKLLYGSFVTIPQGGGFIAGHPAWAGVLFSPHHGLFAWSPLLYAGLAGLASWARRDPGRALVSVLFVLALARLNAGVADWPAGAAFGARRFDATLPVFGLGLAFAIRATAELARRRPLLVPTAALAAAVAWNVLLARAHRTWDQSGAIGFEQMGHGVVSAWDRAAGSPFALPASLLDWLRGGPAPRDWESQYMTREFERWSIRMGVDDRLFLEGGWSAPLGEGQETWRRVEGEGGIVSVFLHRARDYRLGVRMRAATAGTRVRVVLNQQSAGSWTVGPEWEDHVLDLSSDWFRPGRNTIRLRADAEGVGVAGVWLE
jgi:hypothetical protein